jgi:hypothetical protein
MLSSLARIVALHSVPITRLSLTRGVLPITSVMSLAICEGAQQNAGVNPSRCGSELQLKEAELCSACSKHYDAPSVQP